MLSAVTAQRRPPATRKLDHMKAQGGGGSNLWGDGPRYRPWGHAENFFARK